MNVVDLWADRNVKKYLVSCKLSKDKLMLSKIASVRHKNKEFLNSTKKTQELVNEKNNLAQQIKKKEIEIFKNFKRFTEIPMKMHKKKSIFEVEFTIKIYDNFNGQN